MLGAFMSILEKLKARHDQVNSLLTIGLDSDIKYIPRQFRDDPFPQFAFNRWVIEETHTFAAAYKMNTAFYESRGDRGMSELKMTVDYLQERHQPIFTICDAKRADMGTTNAGYIEAIYDWMGFDGVTLHPYLGKQAIQLFLDREDKAAIILCRTSNPGAKDIQDIEVNGHPLWYEIAERVCNDWNVYQNCMLVVGGTYPAEIQSVRGLVGDMPLLVPSVGSQSGTLKKVVEAGLNSEQKGLLINSSRSIIFADDPANVARRMRDEINQHRLKI